MDGIRKELQTKFNFILILLVITGLGCLTTLNTHAQPVCKVQQITNDPVDDSDQPTISRDGNLIAFRSEANFTGQNPDNNDEIFIYNVRQDEFTQATFSTGGNNGNPYFSSDGKYIVFDSGADINGVPNNGERQVFLHNVMTGANTQITNATDGSSNQPSINGLNSQIAFSSSADLTNDNPLNLTQIFLYNITNGTFQQITNSVFGITIRPSSNFEGDRIAFESSADLTGQNPIPGGIREIFLYNRDTDSLSQITQNTEGSASVTDSAIDGSGNLISLTSTANPNGGGDFPGNGSHVFLFDGTSPIEQITTGLANAGIAAISEDGSCIAFNSSNDITGQNPLEIRQIFLFDIDTGMFTQVSDVQPGTGNDPQDPRPNGDCTRITYSRQITFNSNVGQIFVATCLDPANARNIPTLSEWGLIAMAAILGIVGLLVVRRRAQAA